MSVNSNNSSSTGGGGGGKFSDTNLIVNYLPPALSDADFKSMFESIGPVSASRIIRDRTTGLSYGYGFIDYADPDNARKAIEVLDGMQLQNKRLKVSLSRQGDDVRASNLYISNLPKFITEVDLQNLFGKYGSIIQTKILTDPGTGVSRGVGFVRFSTREEAQVAMDATNGTKPVGYSSPIAVKFAEDNREKAKKIQQAILSGTMPGTNYPVSGPIAAAAAAMGLRPPVPPSNGPMGGANQFGMGYQGDLGGGPMRSGQPRQRFDPMAFGGGNMPGGMGAAGMFGGAGMNGFGGAMGGMAESPAGYPLFVYNIGTDTDERALFQLFYPFGALQKVTVVRDGETKQSKGYGFVTMVHMHEAQNAIKNLNGMLFNDKRLQVSLKQPKGTQQQQMAMAAAATMGPSMGQMTPQSPMMGAMSPLMGSQTDIKNGSSPGADPAAAGHVLFVYNIGLDADERQLWQLFQPFGAILKVHVARTTDTRKSKGFGFVTMAQYQEAQSAINSLNGVPYGGRNLQVSFKQAGVGKSTNNASSAAFPMNDFRGGMGDMGRSPSTSMMSAMVGMGYGNGLGGGYGSEMGSQMGQFASNFVSM